MIKRISTDILQHIRQNLILYLIIIFALLTGIAAGSFTAGAMSEIQRQDLGGYLKYFFEVVLSENIDKGSIFFESIWQHFQITLLIWLSGLFFFGIPFICVLVGVRGFFIGFTIGFLIGNYGFGGTIFALICLIPQTLIYIPCFIGIGVIALEYSINKFKSRKISYSREQNLKRMTPYTIRILMLFGLLVIGSLVEAFVTPLYFIHILLVQHRT